MSAQRLKLKWQLAALKAMRHKTATMDYNYVQYTCDRFKAYTQIRVGMHIYVCVCLRQ